MNFQSVGSDAQPTGRYRREFLVALLDADGRSGREIAKEAGISHTNFYEVCEGKCIKIETLGSVVDVFKPKFPKLKLMHLFDEDSTLDRFRRSVLGGGPRAAMKAGAGV